MSGPKGPTKFDEAARAAALDCCSRTGNRSAAATAAGVTYDTLSYYINHEEFKLQWKEARAKFVATLEGEAFRRAVEGWDEERASKDGVYHVRKYSDTLLAILLKANDPNKYREQVKIENVDKTKSLGLDQLSPESRRQLREILEREKNKGEERGAETDVS